MKQILQNILKGEKDMNESQMEAGNSWAERVGLEGWQLPLSPAFYAGDPESCHGADRHLQRRRSSQLGKLLGSSHQPGREASQGILEDLDK